MTTRRATKKAATVLVLRTCSAEMTSHGGTFTWPSSGPVECSDWLPTAECGNGLHGLLWGEGAGSLLSWSASAKWLVVEVDASTVVDLAGKVKFPRGEVVYCGDRDGAVAYLDAHGAADKVVTGAIRTAGDSGTATAGYYGTATAGYHGTATAGYHGTATAGDHGTATAGDHGTATAGYHGTATAGDSGTLVIKRWNGKRYVFSVGYVGEDGIKANVAYRLDGEGKFVRRDAQP